MDLDDCGEAYTVPDDARLAVHPSGVERWTLDLAAANRLWQASFVMLVDRSHKGTRLRHKPTLPTIYRNKK